MKYPLVEKMKLNTRGTASTLGKLHLYFNYSSTSKVQNYGSTSLMAALITSFFNFVSAELLV